MNWSNIGKLWLVVLLIIAAAGLLTAPIWLAKIIWGTDASVLIAMGVWIVVGLSLIAGFWDKLE